VRKQDLLPERIERVVVRGVNWVGDAVMTVPALRELRRVLPHAHITLATRAWAEGVFADADFLDDIMIAPARDSGGGLVRARLREINEWRKRRFDLALLFPNAFEESALGECFSIGLADATQMVRQSAWLPLD
jgi:heptosyltransferase-2